jgi:hypothetical protein
LGVWRLGRPRRMSSSLIKPTVQPFTDSYHSVTDQALKGPKLGIFDYMIFTQIRPVWVGDIGTRPKKFPIFMV